ncbi:hypothetical protein PMAYCL1PPCAC_27532, partial [Pristionchus mayeri]
KKVTSPLLNIPTRQQKSTIVFSGSPCPKIIFNCGHTNGCGKHVIYVKRKYTGNDIFLETIYMDEVRPARCEDGSPFRLDFFDDHSISPVHRIYSDCSKTADFRLRSSSIAIRYRNKSAETRGFFIKYRAVCTKMYNFAGLSGTIRSPSIPYTPMDKRQLRIVFRSTKAKSISKEQKNDNNVTCGGYVFRLLSGDKTEVTIRDPMFGEVVSEKSEFCSTEEEIVQIRTSLERIELS